MTSGSLSGVMFKENIQVSVISLEAGIAFFRSVLTAYRQIYLRTYVGQWVVDRWCCVCGVITITGFRIVVSRLRVCAYSCRLFWFGTAAAVRFCGDAGRVVVLAGCVYLIAL